MPRFGKRKEENVLSEDQDQIKMNDEERNFLNKHARALKLIKEIGQKYKIE